MWGRKQRRKVPRFHPFSRISRLVDRANAFASSSVLIVRQSAANHPASECCRYRLVACCPGARPVCADWRREWLGAHGELVCKLCSASESGRLDIRFQHEYGERRRARILSSVGVSFSVSQILGDANKEPVRFCDIDRVGTLPLKREVSFAVHP